MLDPFFAVGAGAREVVVLACDVAFAVGGEEIAEAVEVGVGRGFGDCGGDLGGGGVGGLAGVF